MPKLIQHSAATVEHYTPIAIVEAARETLGAIDLDPATTASVNDSRVKATAYCTREDDGLSKEWRGRIFLNPPGGKGAGNRSNAAIWWAKLISEFEAGRVTSAIFVGFNLEILATSQDAGAWIGEFPFCIPRKRLDFSTELDGKFSLGGSPAHSNVITLVTGLAPMTQRFIDSFSPFGKCSRGAF